MPSFITWNNTSRSMVSSRKAVKVISFSGSSSNGREVVSNESLSNHDSAYLALEQVSDLLLNALCFSKQAFLDRQSFKTAFASAYVVDFGCAILDAPTKQVLGVCSDVMALSLHCYTAVSTSLQGRLFTLRPA